MASSRLLLAFGTALVSLAMACAPGEPSESVLDQFLCAPATLGDDFQELIRGEFTPKDLADLSDDAEAREAEFRDAGMEDGKFVYYKSVLPRPPFDPPINVVCQVLEFDTEAGAERWVRSLRPTDALETLAFGRVPREDVTEEEAIAPAGLATSDRAVRAFRASGGTGDERTFVQYLVGREGRMVRTVSVGRQGGFIDNEGPDFLLHQLWLNREGR